MPVQNTIVGGSFQDSEGNVLAFGYLIFQLTADAQITGIGQLCSGTQVKVPLDVNGNIEGTVNIWPNNVLNPNTTQYVIYAYSAKGQLVWTSTRQITSTPVPYSFSGT